MEEQMNTTPTGKKSEKSFRERNSLSIKIVLIGILILLLLLPISMIKDLIGERMATADLAIEEVQQKWSGSQEIVGPILSIPYYKTVQEATYDGKESKFKKATSYLHILPETLDIHGQITTQELKRGLYEIVVYNTPLELKGKFRLPKNFADGIAKEDLLHQSATLNIGLSDLRGLNEQIELKWGNDTFQFNPGLSQNDILSSGVSIPLGLASFGEDQQNTVEYTIRLNLKGSQSLLFAPLGKTTTASIQSNCHTPSFTGAFLPTDREITETGFKSTWKILDLNRNYPQVFTGQQQYVDWASFGVNLLMPVQQYQQSMRSVKYAFLIIILTFVVSFFVEVTQRKNIHPFQYLLVGLALCLFYTLLTAISEHIGFAPAYLLSSIMTIALLTLYMLGILKIKKTAILIGGLLAVLYAYIFVLIRMETYALLAGSVGLFIILAVIMYYSQKINWTGK